MRCSTSSEQINDTDFKWKNNGQNSEKISISGNFLPKKLYLYDAFPKRAMTMNEKKSKWS